MASQLPNTIAIVGGGFSGAALAWHLRRKNVTADIVVIEPRADLGRGLAYATPDPAHRINVPATRMILDETPPEVLESVMADIPLRRLAEPSEVAEMVAFLASDQNTYASGGSVSILSARLKRRTSLAELNITKWSHSCSSVTPSSRPCRRSGR